MKLSSGGVLCMFPSFQRVTVFLRTFLNLKSTTFPVDGILKIIPFGLTAG